MPISIFHEITSTDNDDDLYHGETWAEDADGERGYIKWHSDGCTTFIDRIETDGRTPFLGFNLIKTLWHNERQKLDPGMMNADGKRLWRLLRARDFY
jgi:hypothetical protein